MAEICGLGQVAEWFKAAVLKTAADHWRIARKSHKSAIRGPAMAAITAVLRCGSRHSRRHSLFTEGSHGR